MNHLLPPNASALEQLAAQALAQAIAQAVPLRDLISPERCPVALLPYLAWAFSVDRWDTSWSAATKRQVVKNAYYIHAHKGTIGALRRVVEPLGYLLRVIEWWQTTPLGTPGTFGIEVGVLDTGITEAMYQALVQLIDDAKPLTRPLIGLAISLESRGTVHLAASACDGETLTVYPYAPGPIEVSSNTLLLGGAAHSIDTMSVYP